MLGLMLRPHYREAAPVGILLHLVAQDSISSGEIKEAFKMLKMTLVQLGVLLLVICLSTQVVSQNTTITTGTKTASISNNNSTAVTAVNSSGNSTKPTGAGVSLHAGAPSVLTPIIVAASLLQRYC